MVRTLSPICALVALSLSAMTGSASAQRVTDTVVGSCVYAFGTANCVRQYRYGDAGNSGIQTLKGPSEEDLAESRERERRWVERCRPIILPDSHGVGRYSYTARGCEYGRDRD